MVGQAFLAKGKVRKVKIAGMKENQAKQVKVHSLGGCICECSRGKRVVTVFRAKERGENYMKIQILGNT